MRVRFRALITLDAVVPRQVVKEYPNNTHALVVRVHDDEAGFIRSFPAEMCWDDEEPIHSGDHAVVTITLVGDEAAPLFEAGCEFILWSGKEAGHGVVSRRVIFEHGPS
jgi:hypothetical protein